MRQLCPSAGKPRLKNSLGPTVALSISALAKPSHKMQALQSGCSATAANAQLVEPFRGRHSLAVLEQESSAMEWSKRTTWNIINRWCCFQQMHTSRFCWCSLFYKAPCVSAQPLLCWLDPTVQGTEYCSNWYGLGFDNVGKLGLAALSWYCMATNVKAAANTLLKDISCIVPWLETCHYMLYPQQASHH